MSSQVLSADSHVVEPPDLWTARMQAEFRDRAPRLVRGLSGDVIVCDPLPPFSPAGIGSAGIRPEDLERFHEGGYASCRPGGWDPVERLKDMDADGIAAEIFYCGYGMALFGHPDDAFQRAAHRAYNDWACEYASHEPSRLFAIANISMTDPAEDINELRRIRKMGFRGIMISNDPLPQRRYDNPMWEPFWSEVEEYDLPVNIHILTRQSGPESSVNPIIVGAMLPIPSCRTIAELITGGVLERHPALKVVSVENDIGWIPNWLKRLEWHSYRYAPRYPQLTMNAADYWRRQVFATFQDDLVGIRCRDLIGVDRLMWGSDYPHFDSTFPNSREAIERNFAGVPERERAAILGGVMSKLYHLQALETA